MAAPSAPPRKLNLPPDFGPYAAMYVTIVAFSFVTLISVKSLWSSGAWLLYLLGVITFAILIDRCSRKVHPSRAYLISCIVIETIIVLVLSVLTDYFFLTTMLSFLIVASVQGDLPRSQSYGMAFLILLVITITYWIGAGPSAAVQIFFGLGAGFIFIVVFTELAQRERQARQDLQRANQQLAEYAGQVEQLATMRERNRLAREVHDTLGHYLTVISVQLEVVTKLINSNPARAEEAAAKAKALASEGLNEIRRSVAALRPSPLEDKPLPEAIRALIETSRDAGLMVTFDQIGAQQALPPDMETVLYRAAQESLTNIRKHAHASAANVRLTYAADTIGLRVRDNGVGRKADEDNVGLSALRERVAALHGTVLAENHLEGGFLLEVTLPVSNQFGVAR